MGIKEIQGSRRGLAGFEGMRTRFRTMPRGRLYSGDGDCGSWDRLGEDGQAMDTGSDFPPANLRRSLRYSAPRRRKQKRCSNLAFDIGHSLSSPRPTAWRHILGARASEQVASLAPRPPRSLPHDGTETRNHPAARGLRSRRLPRRGFLLIVFWRLQRRLPHRRAKICGFGSRWRGRGLF
jgi:hypothetical protein